MKEAIGSSMILNLIIIFAAVLIGLYVGSIAYTKGFKVRNRIIDIIERREEFSLEAEEEIDSNLRDIGYRIVDRECPVRNGVSAIDINSPYRYCIYEYETSKGPYYGVTVFIHFDIPLIGNFFELPLYGETKIIFESDRVTG